MFNVSALLLDDALKPVTPLTNVFNSLLKLRRTQNGANFLGHPVDVVRNTHITLVTLSCMPMASPSNTVWMERASRKTKERTDARLFVDVLPSTTSSLDDVIDGECFCGLSTSLLGSPSINAFYLHIRTIEYRRIH